MSAWKVLRLVGVLASLPLAGCALKALTLDNAAADAVGVKLDANARVHHPGRQLKFFVDVINRGDRSVRLNDLRIELLASPVADEEVVSFRKEWSYGGAHWEKGVFLRSGAKATIPIVPEGNVEFPLELLEPGPYHIVAVVNDRFRAAPYELLVVRPDLRPEPLPLESLRRLFGNGR